MATSNSSGRRLGWFGRHRALAIIGIAGVLVAFVLGMVMWLGARLANQDPGAVVIMLHVLTAVGGLLALLLAAITAWRRPARLTLARVTTLRQQWVLQHRLLALGTLFLGAVMVLTGVGLLLGLLLANQQLALVYGHLITAVMVLPLAIAAFLVGWFPVRRNRFGNQRDIKR